jgi:hypothetical protein
LSSIGTDDWLLTVTCISSSRWVTAERGSFGFSIIICSFWWWLSVTFDEFVPSLFVECFSPSMTTVLPIKKQRTSIESKN